MAKIKAVKTKIQLAADTARANYAKAKEANEKNDNPTTQKALSDASAARDSAVTAESRERFLRVGGQRVSKAVSAINNVGKLAAPRSYEYSETDIAKAEAAITGAATAALTALRNAKQKTAGKTQAPGFAFE